MSGLSVKSTSAPAAAKTATTAPANAKRTAGRRPRRPTAGTTRSHPRNRDASPPRERERKSAASSRTPSERHRRRVRRFAPGTSAAPARTHSTALSQAEKWFGQKKVELRRPP